MQTMKKWLIFATLLAILSMSARAEGTTNVSDDFSTEKWSDWKAEKTILEFRHNPELGHKAPGALEIIVGPDNPPTAGGCFLRHFAIKPGQSYTALVYVRAKEMEPGSRVSLGFQGMDENKKFLGVDVKSTFLKAEDVPSDGWRRMVLSFIVPETGKWERAAILLCTLGIADATTGHVYFDDFEFFQTEE